MSSFLSSLVIVLLPHLPDRFIFPTLSCHRPSCSFTRLIRVPHPPSLALGTCLGHHQRRSSSTSASSPLRKSASTTSGTLPGRARSYGRRGEYEIGQASHDANAYAAPPPPRQLKLRRLHSASDTYRDDAARGTPPQAVRNGSRTPLDTVSDRWSPASADPLAQSLAAYPSEDLREYNPDPELTQLLSGDLLDDSEPSSPYTPPEGNINGNGNSTAGNHTHLHYHEEDNDHDDEEEDSGHNSLLALLAASHGSAPASALGKSRDVQAGASPLQRRGRQPERSRGSAAGDAVEEPSPASPRDRRDVIVLSSAVASITRLEGVSAVESLSPGPNRQGFASRGASSSSLEYERSGVDVFALASAASNAALPAHVDYVRRGSFEEVFTDDDDGEEDANHLDEAASLPQPITLAQRVDAALSMDALRQLEEHGATPAEEELGMPSGSAGAPVYGTPPAPLPTFRLDAPPLENNGDSRRNVYGSTVGRDNVSDVASSDGGVGDAVQRHGPLARRSSTDVDWSEAGLNVPAEDDGDYEDPVLLRDTRAGTPLAIVTNASDDENEDVSASDGSATGSSSASSAEQAADPDAVTDTHAMNTATREQQASAGEELHAIDARQGGKEGCRSDGKRKSSTLPPGAVHGGTPPVQRGLMPQAQNGGPLRPPVVLRRQSGADAEGNAMSTPANTATATGTTSATTTPVAMPPTVDVESVASSGGRSLPDEQNKETEAQRRVRQSSPMKRNMSIESTASMKGLAGKNRRTAAVAPVAR